MCYWADGSSFALLPASNITWPFISTCQFLITKEWNLSPHTCKWWSNYATKSSPSKVHVTYLITPWSRVHLDKLTGSQLVKKFPHLMEFESRLMRLQVPPPVPILSQIDAVHSPPSHFLKINLNIILGLPNGLVPHVCPPKTNMHLSSPHMCYTSPRPS